MKNKIKELRAERRMTQDQLAARLDVSRQTIISLERERYNPSINLAFKIARVFQCSIEDIFIYEEENE
jgi:putative transcriptional regulator